MYIPKKYGQSRVDKCPFCGMQGVFINSQGIPVCTKHKNSQLGPMKCVCGASADLLNGKFGIYFNCLNCGNINARKIFEVNKVEDVNTKGKEIVRDDPAKTVKKKDPPTTITINSDDPLYM
jgi:hypothetical protein